MSPVTNLYSVCTSSRNIFYECTLFFCIDLKSGRYHTVIHCKGTGTLNTENNFSSVSCSVSHIFDDMELSVLSLFLGRLIYGMGTRCCWDFWVLCH